MEPVESAEAGQGVDATGWPVVVVRIGETADAALAESIIEDLDELVARGERMGLVFDYRNGGPVAVEAVSKWLARSIDALERVVAGGVTVVAPDSVERVQEMIGSGMFSLPFPSWATATEDEARAWVSERLGPPG